MTPEPPINRDVQSNQKHYQHMLWMHELGGGWPGRAWPRPIIQLEGSGPGREFKVDEEPAFYLRLQLWASDRHRLGAQAEQPWHDVSCLLFSLSDPLLDYSQEGFFSLFRLLVLRT